MDLTASVNHLAHYVILKFGGLLTRCFELNEQYPTILHKDAIRHTALGWGHKLKR